MSLPSSLQNMDSLTLERFREIVQMPSTFESPAEEQVCREVVEKLSEDEILSLANVSYAHWVLHRLEDPLVSTSFSATTRTENALKAIRWQARYLGVNQKDPSKSVDKTLERVQSSIAARKEHQMDMYRTCFDQNATSPEEEFFRTDIRNDLERQLQVLRGKDKRGRAIVIKVARTKGGTTEQEYVRQQLYSAERAMAVSEFMSSGENDTTYAIFSLQNQNSKFSPAISWQLGVIKVLQLLYPGRMGRVLVLDAPFLIRQVFAVIKPLLAESLRKTTDLVAGEAKLKILEEEIGDRDLLTTEGTLTKPVDLTKYLQEVPFYCSYDYDTN
eukprot:Nitzschia sp. Nitz4//scaffold63_size106090//49882//50868//NITZ4_004391-RA/size106090-processed-gene-0.126-mRNA-1//1//CDS//3329555978//7401//frame0